MDASNTSVQRTVTDEAVAALIRTHVQRYNEIDILDVYKLLHQGVFGPGHAVTNQRAAKEWLERESEIQTPNAGELLAESVHPAGEIVRVHLRPYIAAGGSLKKLLDAFIRSAKAADGDPTTMAAWWGVFQHMTEPGGVLVNRYSARTVSLVGRTRATEKWPASPHSPPYDRSYKPAYRVLTRELAEALLTSQEITFSIM
jgi:hypothetical protein